MIAIAAVIGSISSLVWSIRRSPPARQCHDATSSSEENRHAVERHPRCVRIAPRSRCDMIEDLSELAQRLGRHMADRLENGMVGHFRDDLLEAFPDEDTGDIAKALSELQSDGLVTLRRLIGPVLPSVQTNVALFEACDPAITGHSPLEDSVALAQMLIDDPELGHVPDLEAATGWPRRRFNPALGLLMREFPERRRRMVDHQDYPTLGLIVGDDEIASLRRYVRCLSR